MSAPAPSEVDRLIHRLKSRRAAARIALLLELLWPGLWPSVGVAGLFVCLALTGVLRLLPPWAHWAILAASIAACGGLLVRGLIGLRLPDARAADRRLEAASGFRHQPLAVLADRPARAAAGPDPAQDALWQAHVSRVLRQVRRLRVGLPRPGLARLDRRALRGALAVALVAALVIAGPEAPSRLAEALRPPLPAVPEPPTAQLQVWISPPAYTGLAPVFLKPGNGPLSVPAGAHLTASLTGGDGGTPSLVLNGHGERFRALDAGSFQGELDLEGGGRLEVMRDGRELAAWDVAVVGNQPPDVAWTESPGQAARGLQTRLPWQASDAYGVVQLGAEIRLAARPGAPPLLITIPVPGGTTKSARAVMSQDLTGHPWAGLAVTARLVGRNAAGLNAASADAGFTLPERAFRNPMARMLVEVRKGLSVDPEDRDNALRLLGAVLGTPEALALDSGSYLNLADIHQRLLRDPDPAAVGEAQAQMWELALHLEDGGTERTARAVEAARQAAREALERATRQPTEANRAELDRKLSELEAAVREHLDALRDQARRENAEASPDADAQRLDSRDLDRAAEAARDAARQGRMDEAQQRMAELEQMLEQLQNARPEHGSRDSADNSAKRQRGQQQMGALQDMIGRQGRLLDRAQGRASEGQRADRAPGSRAPSEPQGNSADGKNADGKSGQAQEDHEDHEDDQRVQRALRRALGELMQQFGDLTGDVPRSLSDADQAMRDAGAALGQGRDGPAGQAEQRAIEALQKGGREMGRQMARQFGRGQPGQGEEGEGSGETGLGLQDGRGERDSMLPGSQPGQRGDAKRDPLGRQLGQGNAGSDDSDTVRIPEEMERQRTRLIQDELRRRGGERSRPQPELDYIGRLLKEF